MTMYKIIFYLIEHSAKGKWSGGSGWRYPLSYSERAFTCQQMTLITPFNSRLSASNDSWFNMLLLPRCEIIDKIVALNRSRRRRPLSFTDFFLSLSQCYSTWGGGGEMKCFFQFISFPAFFCFQNRNPLKFHYLDGKEKEEWKWLAAFVLASPFQCEINLRKSLTGF